MEFQKKLEEMLQKVEYGGNEDSTFKYRDTAENLANYTYPEEYFDPVLKILFSEDFEFSETREAQLKVISKELILNSSIACKERKDLYIEYSAYVGEKGVVFHVTDEGPGFNHRYEIEKRKLELHKYDDTEVLSFGENGIYPSRDGNGIYSLLAYSQEFSYNEKGTEVIARFELSK